MTHYEQSTVSAINKYIFSCRLNSPSSVSVRQKKEAKLFQNHKLARANQVRVLGTMQVSTSAIGVNVAGFTGVRTVDTPNI